MSDVKRYSCYGLDGLGYPYDALSTEDDDGDWVTFEQYDRDLAVMRRQRDEALKRLAKLETAASRLLEAHDSCGPYFPSDWEVLSMALTPKEQSDE
jgi:hypothetical protein